MADFYSAAARSSNRFRGPISLRFLQVQERKKREIDPTLTKLRALEMERPASAADDHAHGRIAELRELIELLTGWYDDMNDLETERLVQLLKLGSKIQSFVKKTGRIVALPGQGAKSSARAARE